MARGSSIAEKDDGTGQGKGGKMKKQERTR